MKMYSRDLPYNYKIMFNADILKLPYALFLGHPWGIVGTLSFKRIFTNYMLFDAGCGVSLGIYNSDFINFYKKDISSLNTLTYNNEELNDKLFSFIGKIELPDIYFNMVNREQNNTLYKDNENKYCLACHYGDNTISSICINWFNKNYGASTSDIISINKLIELTKLCQEYAKNIRLWYFNTLNNHFEVNYVDYIDSPHVWLDDNNLFRIGVQKAGINDFSIQRRNNSVYVFKGLNNKDWNYSICGVIHHPIFDIDNFKTVIKDTAYLIDTFNEV